MSITSLPWTPVLSRAIPRRAKACAQFLRLVFEAQAWRRDFRAASSRPERSSGFAPKGAE